MLVGLLHVNNKKDLEFQTPAVIKFMSVQQCCQFLTEVCYYFVFLCNCRDCTIEF